MFLIVPVFFGITSAVHYTIKTIQIYIVLCKSYLDASCVFIINPSVEFHEGADLWPIMTACQYNLCWGALVLG